VLAPNFEGLFGKKFCDLLVRLEVASLGCGKEIAYILAKKATKEIFRNAKKSLSSKRKKEARRKERFCSRLIDELNLGCCVSSVGILHVIVIMYHQFVVVVS
jgi:hypothetical protein